MSYPNFKEDPTLLKITTKDDEIEELKHTTEKQGFGNIIKSLEDDNKFYGEKRKKFQEKTTKHFSIFVKSQKDLTRLYIFIFLNC